MSNVLYQYSVADDTLNGAISADKLHRELAFSGISTSLAMVATIDDELNIYYIQSVTTEEEAILDQVVADHDGEEDTEAAISITTQPFASKMLDTGEKLYRRKHGVRESIAAESSGTITIAVPYSKAKIDEVEIVNCAASDTCNFSIYDTATGTYSGVPNYKLNQFGFDVNLSDIYYTDTSNYDAELYYGMVIEVEYYNNETEAKDIGVNFVLHEIKAV